MENNFIVKKCKNYVEKDYGYIFTFDTCDCPLEIEKIINGRLKGIKLLSINDYEIKILISKKAYSCINGTTVFIKSFLSFCNSIKLKVNRLFSKENMVVINIKNYNKYKLDKIERIIISHMGNKRYKRFLKFNQKITTKIFKGNYCFIFINKEFLERYKSLLSIYKIEVIVNGKLL